MTTDGRQYLMEHLSEVASIYTAELRAIHLALSHVIGSTVDTLIICIDYLSYVQT